MTAIGFAHASQAAASGFEFERAGRVATLFDRNLPTPMERLAACMTCAARLNSFLPLPPRRPISATDATSWAKTRQAAIAAELARIEGFAQISVELTRKEPLGPGLRARAAAKRENSRAIDHLRRALSSESIHQRTLRRAVYVDALVQRTDTGMTRERLATLHPDIFQPWRITVTGPWPPFRFLTELP